MYQLRPQEPALESDNLGVHQCRELPYRRWPGGEQNSPSVWAEDNRGGDTLARLGQQRDVLHRYDIMHKHFLTETDMAERKLLQSNRCSYRGHARLG